MTLKVRLFGKNFFVEGSPYGKKALAEDYYNLEVFCNNCKDKTIIYIKKGVHLNDIVTKVKCSYCEVRLEKEEK